MSDTTGAAAEDPGAVLDLALGRYVDGDAASATRICGALLERLPRYAAGWFVAGLGCGALGEADAAATALHTAFHLARGQGQLALATAAAYQLGAYGDDTHDRLRRLADDYLAGTGGAPLPPPRPMKRSFSPWPAQLSPGAMARKLEGLAQQELPAWSGSSELRPAPRAPWAGLETMGLTELLLRFRVAFAAAGTTLVHEDSTGNEVFVIAWGSAAVHRAQSSDASTTLAVLGSDDIFGEMAALSRTLRTANVTAQSASVVLVAEASALDEVVEHHPRVGSELVAHCRHRMLENLFRASPVLRVVEESDRGRLLGCFKTLAFEAGDTLMRPGEVQDGLHVIALGKLRMSEAGSQQTPAVIRDLGIGDVVGEAAVVLRRPGTTLVTALVPSVTLWLAREQFLHVVEEHPLVLRELYALALKRTETLGERPDPGTSLARDIVLV